MMKSPQLLSEVRHPEPLENLVESVPVKDGMKLSEMGTISHTSFGESWTDLQGLGWLFSEEWS